VIYEGSPGFVNGTPGQQLEPRNKSANKNVKMQFIYMLTGSDTSKTAKKIQKGDITKQHIAI